MGDEGPNPAAERAAVTLTCPIGGPLGLGIEAIRGTGAPLP